MDNKQAREKNHRHQCCYFSEPNKLNEILARMIRKKGPPSISERQNINLCLKAYLCLCLNTYLNLRNIQKTK